MSKRQRFFVELNEGEVTVISWKKLVADAERLSSGSGAHKASTLITDLPKSSSNLKLAVSSCTVTSETGENKPHGISPLDQDTDFSSCDQERKSNGSSIMDSSLEEAKIEVDDAAKQVEPCTLNGKVHRATTPTACDSVHANTSRTKETKITCVCCLEVDLTGRFLG